MKSPKPKPIKVKITRKIVGVSKVATACGVTECHVSHVLRGLRQSPRINEKAKELGVIA